MKNKIIMLLVFAFILSNSAFAIYGARPLGMGGAFTAIADDATAAYWNPAGFAINPGVDIMGNIKINNRNTTIGDNLASIKMCIEAEINPFEWMLGVGAVSMLALEGAQYLSDKGVVKKNWGRPEPTTSKDQPLADQVEQSGTQNTQDVAQQAKDTVKDLAKKALSKAKDIGKSTLNTAVQAYAQESAKQAYWGNYAYPYYHYNYSRPTYWDERDESQEHSARNKAQFAGAFTLMSDSNSVANQNTNYYSFSLATGYQEMVAFGANLNVYDIMLTQNSLKGLGAGLDLGMLLRPIDKISFGIVAKEILTTDVHFSNGANVRFPMTVNAGAAIKPIDMLTVAADVENIFRQNNTGQILHAGAELRPFPGFALRGGLSGQNKTAGASIMVESIIIDYAYLGGTYNKTQLAGVTWKL